MTENRGQGIQKICDECKGIGAELPIYELTGTTLRIRFKALESALLKDKGYERASHTGKTVLAQRMLEKYKYPYVSIDHLKMGLIRSGNTHLTPEDDDELVKYNGIACEENYHDKLVDESLDKEEFPVM